MFNSLICVRFGDVDAAGIVYYPRFFHYYHLLLEDFLASRGFSLPLLLNAYHIGLPVVRLEATFKHPLRLGDVCQGTLSVKEVGAVRLTLHYQLKTPGGELAAEATVTSACTDLDMEGPTFFPAALKECLEAELRREERSEESQKNEGIEAERRTTWHTQLSGSRGLRSPGSGQDT